MSQGLQESRRRAASRCSRSKDRIMVGTDRARRHAGGELADVERMLVDLRARFEDEDMACSCKRE